MLETIVGFVALGISIFAIWLVITFYLKSSDLYKEMFSFLKEIKVLSEGIYEDTIAMVREAWPHVWEKETGERLEETKKAEEKIKEEISQEIASELEKIKSLTMGTATEKEIKGSITKLEKSMRNLEKKLKTSLENAFQSISFIARWQSLTPYGKEIQSFLLTELSEHEDGIAWEELIFKGIDYFSGKATGYQIQEHLRRLYERGLVDSEPKKSLEESILKLNKFGKRYL